MRAINGVGGSVLLALTPALSRRERGFTLVTAIFVIVVLATLVTYMLTLSGTQRATSLLALQGARAYAAARSGIEWGIHQSCAGTPASFTLSEGGLNGFAVNVTCSSTTHTEKSTTVTVYHLTSLASYGTYGSPDFVSRQLEATVSDAPP